MNIARHPVIMFGKASVVDYTDWFTMRVNTGASTTFTIPTTGTGYNYTIHTSDGQKITGVMGNHTITFPSSGEYHIYITGSFPRIYFNNGTDKTKLREIVNWGTNQWQSMENAFYGCTSLQTTAAGGDFSQVASFYRFLHGATALNSFGTIDLSSSPATDFRNAWYQNSSLTSFPALDFSNGTLFTYTWGFCTSLASFPLVDMTAATNVQYAWVNCSTFTTFPAIDFPNCTNFFGTWDGCEMSSFPLIDVSKGTNFYETWKDNRFSAFPDLDVSKGTTFQQAWASNFGVITNFQTYRFTKLNNGVLMLTSSTINTTAWSNILIHIEANNINNNVNHLHGGSSKYNASASTARANLVARGWIIYDGGLE